MKKNILLAILILIIFGSCENNQKISHTDKSFSSNNILKEIRLEADLEQYTTEQKQMIKLFIKASKYIDSIFFYENLDNFDEVFSKIDDPALQKKFIDNFGLWDRLNENKPFIKGYESKPLGGNFYPVDLTKEEFQNFDDNCKNSHYSFIRRDENRNLICIPYHIQLKKYNDSITSILLRASELCESENFKEYLIQRVADIQTDNYIKSDSLWVRLQDNSIDFIIGPTQIFDDNLFNLKAEHQSFILLKDEVWTEKMHRYNKWLKFLQKAIPVPEEYRAEEPGSNTSISVYDIIYYGGSGKAGGALISTVLPLESETQISQGVKNLQFKNIVALKFKEILQPISKIVLTDIQEEYISKDAFVLNAILYEMANSLGIKNTIDNNGTVREALNDYFTIADYLKSYSLSLFLAEKLYEVNEIDNDLRDNYFTFVVNLFRLIRFGLNNDYAISNLVCYNYLVENKAITYDNDSHIIINFDKIRPTIEQLIKDIIILQGNGDYEGVKNFIESRNYVDIYLYNIITIINEEKIPTDITILQGEDVIDF